MQLASLAATLVIAVVVTRRRDQRWLVTASVSLVAVGLLCVAAEVVPFGAAAALGVGSGALFSLALTLVVLRADDPQDVGALSAMTHGYGYPLAAAGPVLIGLLHDWTAGWMAPLIALGALSVIMYAAGLAAAREGTISQVRQRSRA
jgi:CP family cyanate transporter-like MFS transporter